MNEPLRPLEREALGFLLDGDHPALEILRLQRRGLSVRGRVFTGSGFLTDLEVAVGVPRLSVTFSTSLSDVNAEVGGRPCGFVLHVRAGLVDTLEAHTWEGDWPDEPGRPRFYYVTHRAAGDPRLEEVPHRDLMALRLPLT